MAEISTYLFTTGKQNCSCENCALDFDEKKGSKVSHFGVYWNVLALLCCPFLVYKLYMNSRNILLYLVFSEQ
jgi:hypothetical protein